MILLDPLSREKEAERWRATLQPEGGWLRGVLGEADQALSAMRAAGHADAAGLVFAIDQEHARRIAPVLRDISGTEPVVAISDEPTASEQIKRFAAGRAKWIICVRMISEGLTSRASASASSPPTSVRNCSSDRPWGASSGSYRLWRTFMCDWTIRAGTRRRSPQHSTSSTAGGFWRSSAGRSSRRSRRG